MSFLVVDVGGASETTIAVAKAVHAEPRRVGSRRFTFAGNERSTIRAEPMVVPVVLDATVAATIATLRTLFADAAQVSCQGDVFNNASTVIACSGELTDEMEVGGARWIATLTLYEVTAHARGIYRMSVNAAGSGAIVVTSRGKRASVVAVAGVGTATAALHAKRRLTVSAAGVATVTATGSEVP
jgi:hypothetical protein